MNLAAACTLTWLPDTLYNSAIGAMSTNYGSLKRSTRQLSPSVQFDIFMKLYRDGRLCQLSYEFCDLNVFLTALDITRRRFELHQIFQALIDHGPRLQELLAKQFCQRCAAAELSPESITNGFNFASFLIEAGWFLDGAKCAEACFDMCARSSDQSSLKVQEWTIESYIWMLEAYNGYCRHDKAMELFEESLRYVDRLSERHSMFCLAELYAQYSSLFFNLGQYAKSSSWALKALRQLKKDPVTEKLNCKPKSIIRVFCLASKAFVMRRQFLQAKILIDHAVALASYYYNRCKRYPAPLLDLAFYLLNVDLNEATARVCQVALDYFQAQFGGRNVRLASAHEDLAYALYVLEYSTGRFSKAKEHAERAYAILGSLFPDNHLLLASCRRVKALILEEIAIDSSDKNYEMALLQEAEDLHLGALSICKRLLGENNIQTAKHYGNLGRLYQSLRRFQEAEQMHLKAVAIKERLLGPDDYEVALSMGHLASLYNYDVARYDDAERLYLRSIEIGKRLFGDTYSGLEYDYRGLVHVYYCTEEREKTHVYAELLHCWKKMRESRQTDVNILNILSQSEVPEPGDTMQVLDDVFSSLECCQSTSIQIENPE